MAGASWLSAFLAGDLRLGVRLLMARSVYVAEFAAVLHGWPASLISSGNDVFFYLSGRGRWSPLSARRSRGSAPRNCMIAGHLHDWLLAAISIGQVPRAPGKLYLANAVLALRLGPAPVLA